MTALGLSWSYITTFLSFFFSKVLELAIDFGSRPRSLLSFYLFSPSAVYNVSPYPGWSVVLASDTFDLMEFKIGKEKSVVSNHYSLVATK